MADGISVRFFTKELTQGLKDLEKRVDRATMWGLREVGRQLKAAAKRRAPVYAGTDPNVEKGRLKKAIAGSRRLKKPAPHTYAMTVGPRGPIVHLYAQKIEGQARFMHDAYNEILPAIPAIFDRGWSRAMKKR